VAINTTPIIVPDEQSGKEVIEALKEQEPDVPIVSFSQIMAWDRCGFAWYLSYREGWTPREKKLNMVLGTLGHEDLKVWYGTHDREAVQQTFIRHYAEYADGGDDYVKLLAEEAWLVLRYIDDFAPANDHGLITLAVEEHFVIPLWTPEGHKFYLQGYVDWRGMVADSSGQYQWLGDHKFTNKNFYSPVEAMMDPQLPTYAAARAWHGDQVIGVFLNMLNTYDYKKKDQVVPEQLFKREQVYLNSQQKDSILHEVGRAVDEMLAIGYLPVAPRRRLRRDCRMCKFQEPCLLSLRGVPIENVLAADFVKRGEETERTDDDELLDISLQW
jgi:hypothetical protein